MKKIMFMLVLCAFVGFSTVTFAAVVQISNTDGTQMGLALFQPSNDVSVFCEADDIAYTVASKHIGGDTFYQSDSKTPGLITIDKDHADAVAKGVDITASNVLTLPTD
jgi:hypothetical protein